jgi:hypothetical protein
MADEQEPKERQFMIPLDGSYGTGPQAEITIYTNTDNGNMKEEIFVFPYALINRTALEQFNTAHLIAGYRILKVAKPSPLSELGL